MTVSGPGLTVIGPAVGHYAKSGTKSALAVKGVSVLGGVFSGGVLGWGVDTCAARVLCGARGRRRRERRLASAPMQADLGQSWGRSHPSVAPGADSSVRWWGWALRGDGCLCMIAVCCKAQPCSRTAHQRRADQQASIPLAPLHCQQHVGRWWAFPKCFPTCLCAEGVQQRHRPVSGSRVPRLRPLSVHAYAHACTPAPTAWEGASDQADGPAANQACRFWRHTETRHSTGRLATQSAPT